MAELTEKKAQPFAFFNISAIALAAHCQATLADTQTKTCQRAAYPCSYLNNKPKLK